MRDFGARRGIPDVIARSLPRAAAWTGAGAAIVGAVIGVVLTVVCWLPAAGSDGRPVSAIRAGVLTYLTAQHGGVLLDGVYVSFVPIGLMVAMALVAWHAGGLLAELADELGALTTPARVQALLLAAASYAVVTAVFIPFGTVAGGQAPVPAVLIAAFILFGAVAGVALAYESDGFEIALPEPVRAGLRGAICAVAVLLAGGALIVAASLIAHAGQVTALSREVGGGLSGVAVLVVSVFSVPNAVVAGSAYLVGPGFAIGSGTSIGLFHATHGTVPAFPLLGALPGQAANPAVLAWAALTVVGAGVATHVGVIQTGVQRALLSTAVAAGAAGVLMAILAWLGGGAVGEHRLRTVGASPWQVGLLSTGEILLVALLTIPSSWIWRWWQARGQTRRIDEPAEEAEERPEEQPRRGAVQLS